MRILVQEVLEASVTIEEEKVASIGHGFLLFVGFTEGDDKKVAERMAEKAVKLRIFPDQNGKTNLSLKDVNGEVLSVSQFTLYANCSEGNRPSFVNAMRPDEARELFTYFNEYLKTLIPNLQTGVFQADMKVSLVNDGPFTIWLDSQEVLK
ncbi:MAG: D-aminoacyl-tRNA deacylase [Bacilli bacterium]|nr:D-aminoacyl-tRNA deacylase [Bacilli bacterium]